MQKSLGLFVVVFMNASMAFGASDTVVARTVAEQKVSPHERAVDDVYKLTMKGVCTYQQFQTLAASLTVEQIYARLKGYDATELHKINDERLARYKEIFDRDPKRAELAKYKQDKIAKYAVLSMRDARYNDVKEARDVLRIVAILTTPIILLAHWAASPLGPGERLAVGTVYALEGALLAFPHWLVNNKIHPYAYCNELIDHARRKELIDKMCRKTVS